MPVRKDNREGEIRKDTRIKRVRFVESREQRIDREDLREALRTVNNPRSKEDQENRQREGEKLEEERRD